MALNRNPIADGLAKTIAASQANFREDDVIDADGYRCCPVCGKRKEAEPVDDPDILPVFQTRGRGIMCDCQKAKEAERKAARERQQLESRIDELRRHGIPTEKYRSYTFANDKGWNPEEMQYCRYYVDHWQKERERGNGILFYGTTGSGKSFAAGCIANAIIEEYREAAFVTSFPALLHMDFQTRTAAINDVINSPLVVLDDLGAEGDDERARKEVYYAVDSRAIAGLPTIFTTNHSLSEIKKPSDVRNARIFDRVLGMCPMRLCMVADSIRQKKAEQAADDERREYLEWKRQNAGRNT